MSSRRQNAFTLIELLVVIAIIAILAAILFPVFAKAREKARQTSCLSNTKQLSLAFIQYAQDYDETYPGPAPGSRPQSPGWVPPNNPNTSPEKVQDGAIFPYVKSAQVFKCPSDSKADVRRLSYSMNCLLTDGVTFYFGIGLGAIDRPASTILLVDEGFTLNDGYFVPNQDKVSILHTDTGNAAFNDGHSKAFRPEKDAKGTETPSSPQIVRNSFCPFQNAPGLSECTLAPTN